MVESTIVNNQKWKYFRCMQRKLFIRVAEAEAKLKKRVFLLGDKK